MSARAERAFEFALDYGEFVKRYRRAINDRSIHLLTHMNYKISIYCYNTEKSRHV